MSLSVCLSVCLSVPQLYEGDTWESGALSSFIDGVIGGDSMPNKLDQEPELLKLKTEL